MVDERERAARPEDITRLFAERAKAKDAEGLASLYEDDAVLAYPPGQMTVGREAIRALYERMLGVLRERHAPVACGVFGASMQVSLCNDGPVTFWLQAR